MHLKFSISYRTAWGESVKVQLTYHDQQGRSHDTVVPLECRNGENWTGEAITQQAGIQSFSYKYAIYRDGQVVRTEWAAVPRFFKAELQRTYLLPDFWAEIPADAPLFTAAVMNTSYTNTTDTQQSYQPFFPQSLQMRVLAPQLQPDEAVAIVGSQPPLGAWHPEHALRMVHISGHEWRLALNATALQSLLLYKYVVVKAATGELVRWEDGDNRVVEAPAQLPAQPFTLIKNDGLLRLPSSRWKAAGVVIPVFSLRTEGSQGIGDFGDLKKMTRWAARTGMKMVQLLPVNDTTQTHTWLDCYPYNAVSVYALHPQYMDLRQLPALKDKALASELQEEMKHLNSLDVVDYERVNNAKMRYLKALYEQEYERVRTQPAFQAFINENEHWLRPYAEFRGEGDIHYYIQYLLHTQLLQAAQYAHKHGVALKGDIPIGISPCSVEAKNEPELFNMKASAGAPPDDFAVDGQNWGFPTYNWDAMAKDGYSWWKRRFQHMNLYFDAYRIDHVLGFFRIWEIPTNAVSGLLGQFYPAKPLSIDEIEDLGLPWRDNLYTRPYITDAVLERLFNKADVAEVRNKYLIARGDGRYDLRPAYETQRQIADMPSDTNSKVRQGLMRLCTNVLFLEDHRRRGMYHPRINAMNDDVINCLRERDRETFAKIHQYFYYERHNEFWREEAMKKLPALVQSTNMLACAEDLGMVPQCVPEVLQSLGVLSLEIQAMPKAYGVRFGDLTANPYLSVATCFTHDMPTLRQWWAEDPERRQAYYNQVLQKDGTAPADLSGWLAEEIISRHLFSPSMLCLLSWQDWMAMDERLRRPDVAAERINIPSNPHNYWRYRMHINLDRLLRQDELNNRILSLIRRSER
ncbi:MAG: 4-alpha-glucanotransferase [Bacteroidaceae bacterium]|nr:4-alpha-glucanotransferase [Bacteroidaceae bacterium]